MPSGADIVILLVGVLWVPSRSVFHHTKIPSPVSLMLGWGRIPGIQSDRQQLSTDHGFRCLQVISSVSQLESSGTNMILLGKDFLLLFMRICLPRPFPLLWKPWAPRCAFRYICPNIWQFERISFMVPTSQYLHLLSFWTSHLTRFTGEGSTS